MKTGNRRRRKLNRLAKARALRARCQAWRQDAERAVLSDLGYYSKDDYLRWMPAQVPLTETDLLMLARSSDVNDAIMSTIDFSWSE